MIAKRSEQKGSKTSEIVFRHEKTRQPTSHDWILTKIVKLLCQIMYNSKLSKISQIRSGSLSLMQYSIKTINYAFHGLLAQQLLCV